MTIGFARRFATYKRANLVFKDLERLRKIGAGKIQFVFSGKAHPRDQGGKQLIRDIFESAEQIADEIPVAFIENYDMHTGLMMTSGVDIWLNNPIRPMEASGTSGMKAAMNGVPNCSILDGWWPEACIHGVNGWAIGDAEDDRDDDRDAENIYKVLESDVLPLWEEDGDGWSNMMKASIAASAGFTGHRMIQIISNSTINFLDRPNQFHRIHSFPFTLFSRKARTRAATTTTPINKERVIVIADDSESEVPSFHKEHNRPQDMVHRLQPQTHLHNILHTFSFHRGWTDFIRFIARIG